MTTAAIDNGNPLFTTPHRAVGRDKKTPGAPVRKPTRDWDPEDYAKMKAHVISCKRSFDFYAEEWEDTERAAAQAPIDAEDIDPNEP